MRVRAFNIETAGPADLTQLRAYLDKGEFRAEDVICILGKTEGNGGRNDFTRELAMRALEHFFAPRLGLTPEKVQERVTFSFSGGTEGIVTPHIVVFVREGQPGGPRRSHKRLAVAIGHTRAFSAEEIGRMAQVEETARALKEIIATMALDGAEDVHLVQMKGAIPEYGYEQGEAARRAGKPLRCDMVYSRAASALGVALALGEVAAGRLDDDSIVGDYSLYSSVASCSAKPGLERTEFLVFANSAFCDGDLTIAHGTLADILDVAGIHRVARSLGIELGVPPDPAQTARIVGVFAKSEADPRHKVRGRRHTMLQDDDIGDTRYSRCVLASVLAATLGETRVYVSTRAEHHGPLGGGPLAIIARAADQPLT